MLPVPQHHVHHVPQESGSRRSSHYLFSRPRRSETQVTIRRWRRAPCG